MNHLGDEEAAFAPAGYPYPHRPHSRQLLGQAQLAMEVRCSRLRLRTPVETIPALLPLAGKSLDLNGHTMRLGVPQVRALIPAPALISRLVTMKRSRENPARTKDYMEPGAFLDAIRRELVRQDIQGEPAIPLILSACRTFTAGWYRPTATFLTPSAAYGLLLNIAGIESRLCEENEAHDGKTPASLTRPGLQRHNYPVGTSGEERAESAKGNKYNITPVRLLTMQNLGPQV